LNDRQKQPVISFRGSSTCYSPTRLCYGAHSDAEIDVHSLHRARLAGERGGSGGRTAGAALAAQIGELPLGQLATVG